MVEGSPRRMSVASHEGCIKKALSEDDEKPRSPLPPEKKQMLRKIESAPAQTSLPSSRWKKLRTTVQIGSAMSAHYKKPPLKREDSFLQRFSTRPTSTPVDLDQPANDFHFTAVLNPDESLLFWWLWVVTLCGLHNSWTLIVRQAFPELQQDLDTLWKVLDGCCDGVYLLDIVVQFRTGYLEQGIMVRDGVRLARHYLASKDFFLDVAALTPLDFMHGIVGESPLLRFPRFLKARRIYKFYYAVESRTAYPNLWRVANLIHVLLLLAHWFGCFYYMLSELEGFQGSWAYRHPESEESPLVRKYLGSVYWSTLTLTTIGDLATPATNLQYLFTIISYLIGVFIFATIVGQVGNVITNRNASRLEFERLLDGAKLYMRHHKVPKGMQRRVQRWYDYSWSRGRMQGGGDIHSALGILPDKLKTELAIHVNLKTLKKVSIFQECQPEFLHDLVLKMRAYIFTPGDLVCRKGEVAREMFIIADGILEVINEKGQVLTQMKAGDFFGEIGILNLDGFNRRTADVRSVGYSELFSLSREDVLSAMKDYPEAEEILQSMGRKRLMEARRANNPDPADTKCGALQPEGQRQEHILDVKVKEEVFLGSDVSKLMDDTDCECDPLLSETESCTSFSGSSDSRQRKIGLALSQLLKGKKESENATHSEQKSSNISCISEGMKKSGSREHHFSELVSKLAHVRQKASEDSKLLSKTDESPAVSTFIDRIIQKQGKMPHMPQIATKKKRSLWHKLARFVHLRHWRTCNLDPALETSEPKVNYCSAKQTDIQNFQISKTVTSPVENRRTSWHPSKPSISNWNRSELFTNSREKHDSKCRRKTLADAGTLLKTTFTQERAKKPLPGILMTGSGQKTLPGILMTGSGLNVKNESPDISPMSSNYSLTPSTSDDDSSEDDEETNTENALQEDSTDKPSPAKKVPKMPSKSESMEDFIKKIVCDFKATMDSYIAETEKEMCLKILRLEEESKKKDAEIEDLQQQIMEQLRINSAEIPVEEPPVKEKPTPEPLPILSTENKTSEDSAICMIDVTTCSPPDTVPEIHFEDEEMWLVEFPQNVTNPFLSVQHPQLRRHSSVEVGHEIPFSLTSEKTEDTFLQPPVPSGTTSPRRFSESQARPEVVLNNSFADRVRRVFAKVKANKASEDSTAESASPPVVFKWPLLTTSKTRRSSCSATGMDKQARQQQFLQLQEEELDKQSETPKTLLPTITESCSFDSLRESPMMELKFHVPPKSPPSNSVVIDLPGDVTDKNT